MAAKLGWRVGVFVLVLLGFTLAAPQPAMAGNCPAAANLIKREGVRGVAALSAGSMNRFRAIFVRNSDMRRIANTALGRYARRIRGAKRRQYYALARRYILKTLMAPLARIKPRKLEVTGCRQTGSMAIVSSTLILKNGNTYPVKWRVRRNRVVDLNVFGIWLALHHQSEFSSIMSANGGDVNALLRHLRGEKVAGRSATSAFSEER